MKCRRRGDAEAEEHTTSFSIFGKEVLRPQKKIKNKHDVAGSISGKPLDTSPLNINRHSVAPHTLAVIQTELAMIMVGMANMNAVLQPVVGMATMNAVLPPGRLIIHGPVSRHSVTLLEPISWMAQKAVKRIFPPQTVAASTSTSTAFVETKPDPILDDKKFDICKKVLACPICYKPLISSSDFDSSLESSVGFKLRCKTCRKDYSENESHFDLTIMGSGKVYGEALPASTEIFRYPLVSFLYERGWRQSFSLWGGFPGPEKEFELIKEYLTPVLGGTIIDASCASGVFSRLFAKSGLFSLVFALDFSETMLQQCYEFIKQEENFPKEKIILVRADISRLPFDSNSVDAVHAGAALHCWPSPSVAVAEISRILRPGGMFVATTYLVDGLYSFIPFLRPFRQTVSQVSGSHIFLSENELKDLCSACGLVDIKFTRNRRFVMISAMKPN